MNFAYRHILLAADFTDDSLFIARKAQAFARVFDARLSLVHVLDNIAMPDTGYGTIVSLGEDSGYDALEREKDRLRALGARLGIGPDSCWLVWGAPETEIIVLAGRLAADLIVVGVHHVRLSFLWGSTAASVLKQADCDVLGVKIPESPDSDASEFKT